MLVQIRTFGTLLCSGFSRAKQIQRLRISLLPIFFFGSMVGAEVPGTNAQTSPPEPPISAIQGKVLTLESNRPVANVIVSVRSAEAGFSRSVLTDIDGQFDVQGTPSGKYAITIEEPGYELFQTDGQVEATPLKMLLYLVPFKTAPAPKIAYTVSVRELSIPYRAQDEFRKGLLELGKNALTESLKHFLKATRTFAGYYEAFYHVGLVQLRLGRRAEAMQSFQEAVTLSRGTYPQAQFGIGYVLYLDDQPVEAEKVLRRGLESDSKFAEGYEILGLVQVKLNHLEDAEKSARAALFRNPNCAGAYLVLSDVYGQRKDYRQQLADLDKYLKLQPTGPLNERVQQTREATLTLLANANPQN